MLPIVKAPNLDGSGLQTNLEGPCEDGQVPSTSTMQELSQNPDERESETESQSSSTQTQAQCPDGAKLSSAVTSAGQALQAGGSIEIFNTQTQDQCPDGAKAKLTSAVPSAGQALQPGRGSIETFKRSVKRKLSPPPRNLSHHEKMKWLQERRRPGLWVQCDDCGNWRYMPEVCDASELPNKWTCDMNPDKSFAKCSVPEASLQIYEEADLIHGPYYAGSVVLARLTGYPWWPAMVDDDPDVERFYWLDGFSDIPTHYNVTFFNGTSEVLRAWIAVRNLKPYAENRDTVLKQTKTYKKRLTECYAQADHALTLQLRQRLERYSFLSLFPGPIDKPKKVSRAEKIKIRQELELKYNITWSDDSSDSDNSTAGHVNDGIPTSSKPEKMSSDSDSTVRKIAGEIRSRLYSISSDDFNL